MPRGKPKWMQKDWREELEPGDVIYEGGSPARPRVVREVSFYKGGWLHSVGLTLKRCSWTHRAFTRIGRADLKSRGFTKSNVRVRLDSPVDAIIEEDIRRCSSPGEPKLQCCDVRGIL